MLKITQSYVEGVQSWEREAAEFGAVVAMVHSSGPFRPYSFYYYLLNFAWACSPLASAIASPSLSLLYLHPSNSMVMWEQDTCRPSLVPPVLLHAGRVSFTSEGLSYSGPLRERWLISTANWPGPVMTRWLTLTLPLRFTHPTLQRLWMEFVVALTSLLMRRPKYQG